jgi:hypothetical protein
MEQCRRRFLQQSLAVLAAPKLISTVPHVVLLGDSIFDNGAYTGGKPDVLTQLRSVLPPSWKASLLAHDGATTEGIPAQLARLPHDATHLALSVGGNNALMRENLLQAPAASTAEAIEMLADAVGDFETAYRKTIAACLAHHLPLVICTIYNGNFDDARYRRLTRTAIALFNDVIVRTAVENRLKVIELRLVCSRPEDYANPIEPSSIGAAKIARAIANAVTGPVPGRGAVLLGG